MGVPRHVGRAWVRGKAPGVHWQRPGAHKASHAQSQTVEEGGNARLACFMHPRGTMWAEVP